MHLKMKIKINKILIIQLIIQEKIIINLNLYPKQTNLEAKLIAL